MLMRVLNDEVYMLMRVLNDVYMMSKEGWGRCDLTMKGQFVMGSSFVENFKVLLGMLCLQGKRK